MSRFVLVTRSESTLDELRATLAPHGIGAVAYPVLREAGSDDPAGWDAVRHALSSLRLTVMTSARAAEPFRRGAEERDLWTTLAGVPVAAVGRATARAATASGLGVSVVGESGATALARSLADRVGPGGAVVHPCGRDRRDELAGALARAGVEVVPVVVYAMEPTPAAELPSLPATAPVAVLLSSPRATRAYLAVCGRRFAGVPHLAMGPTTAAAAAELGIHVTTLANPTPEALVEELCQICS